MAEVFTLITSALGTLTKLKEIADKIKDVEIKSLVADLRLELAEIKERLSEVIDENTNLKAQIQNAAKPQFPPCPSCGQLTWTVEKSVRDATFGDLGGVQRTMKCTACNFTENRLVTP
jgi:hypothetical protein